MYQFFLLGAINLTNTILDAAILQAYQETEYRVFGKTPATLRIGKACPALVSLHASYRTDCSAFITACNPYSRSLSDCDNEGRHAELGLELQQNGLAHIEGIGQHPSNQWRGESSYLVLGLSLEAAETLGKRFEQNAIIWSGPNATPQLVLLR